MTKAVAASAISAPPVLNPYEARLLKDSGVQNKNIIERLWTEGDEGKAKVIGALALGALCIPLLGVGLGISAGLVSLSCVGYNVYKTHMHNQQNQHTSFSALLAQYADGYVHAKRNLRKNPHNKEDARVAQNDARSLLYGRIISIVDVIKSPKDCKIALAVAKELIDKHLTQKKVDPQIRQQVKKDFEANISLAKADQVAKQINTSIGKELIEKIDKSHSVPGHKSSSHHSAYKNKNELNVLVSRGYFSNLKDAQKQIGSCLNVSGISDRFNACYKSWGFTQKI